jgi:hypothetical protein
MARWDLRRRRSIFCAVLTTLAAGSCVLSGCGSGVHGIDSSSSSSITAAVSTGPQLGYLWNAADSSMRPILGVPGSSQFGQPVTTPGAYVFGAASIRSAIAILQSADGTISSQGLPQGTAQIISGAKSGTAQIAFSPSGLNAIVYSPGATTALLITGLNATPQVQTLSAANAITAAVVSDAAQVAAVSGNGAASVALLTGNHGAVASLGGFGGFAFLPTGSDLLMADSATGVVTVVRNTASAPAAQTFTAATIKAPMAVAASVDGRWAVVANGADTSVVRIDLSGATQPLRIACACQPAQLTPLSGNAVFNLVAPGATAGWVVDASAATPRSVFIPAMVKP